MLWPKLTMEQQLQIKHAMVEREFLTVSMWKEKEGEDLSDYYNMHARLRSEIEGIIEHARSKRKKPVKRDKFVPPTLDEVKAYSLERKAPARLAITFHEYYENTEWRDMGGKKVTNWKAKFITWQSKDQNGHQATSRIGNDRNTGTFNEGASSAFE